MKQINLADVKQYLVRNQSNLETGLGLVLNVASTVLAVKGAIEAYKEVESKKKPGEEIPKKKVIGIYAKHLALSIAATAGSIISTIAGKKTDVRKIALLSSAYEFAKEYERQVEKQFGEKKNEEIKAKVLEERKPINDGSEAVSLYDGDGYFFEPSLGKWFISNTVNIGAVVNDVNNSMLINDEAPLKDFLDGIYERTPLAINKQLAKSDLAYELGFIMKNGYIDVIYEEPETRVVNGKMTAYIPIRFVTQNTGKIRNLFEYYEEGKRV